MAKASTRSPGPFNFCPKHNVFFKTCGCSYGKGSKKVEEESHLEDNGTLGV